MENRSVRHEDRDQLDYQLAAARQQTNPDGRRDGSLKGEELKLLIEFFQLLDRWDRQEVVQ